MPASVSSTIPFGSTARTHAQIGCLVSVPVGAAADPVVVWQFEDWPDGSQCVVLVIDELVGSGLDVISGDGIDTREYFCTAHTATVCEDLAPNVLRHLGEGVQLHHGVGL